MNVPDVVSEDEILRRIREGHVEAGWTPESWVERLRQLADACESVNAQRAAELRTWASNVRLLPSTQPLASAPIPFSPRPQPVRY